MKWQNVEGETEENSFQLNNLFEFGWRKKNEHFNRGPLCVSSVCYARSRHHHLRCVCSARIFVYFMRHSDVRCVRQKGNTPTVCYVQNVGSTLAFHSICIIQNPNSQWQPECAIAPSALRLFAGSMECSADGLEYADARTAMWLRWADTPPDSTSSTASPRPVAL